MKTLPLVGKRRSVAIKHTLLVLLLCAALGRAQTSPASLNGSLDVSRGDLNGVIGSTVAASVSIPVGDKMGLQTDAFYTHVSNQDLVGLAAQYHWDFADGFRINSIVAEIEQKYFNASETGISGSFRLTWFTITAATGLERFRFNENSLLSNSNKRSVFGTMAFTFYPSDKFAISLEGSQRFGNRFGVVKVEYQTPQPGLSIFAEAAKGQWGYNHTLFGLRYYFGARKRLNLRQQQDSDPYVLRNLFYAIGNYVADFNQHAAAHNGMPSNSYTGYYTLTPLGGPSLGPILPVSE